MQSWIVFKLFSLFLVYPRLIMYTTYEKIKLKVFFFIHQVFVLFGSNPQNKSNGVAHWLIRATPSVTGPRSVRPSVSCRWNRHPCIEATSRTWNQGCYFSVNVLLVIAIQFTPCIFYDDYLCVIFTHLSMHEMSHII